jgi:two-component system, sensor histidine kinase and response regulator
MPKPILLVEDDIDVQDEVRLLLESNGYTVYTASDGQEALDMLGRLDLQLGLIVSDLAMPIMNGYQLLQAVRASALWHIVPFIFLSGYGTQQNVRTGRELGGDDYIVKPFETAELLSVVQAKLNRFQQIQKASENRLNDSRRALVHLIAHELRTPLTYISGGYSLLEEEIPSPESETVASSMELIRSGTVRMTRIVDQATLYSELASGHVRVQIDTVGAVFDPATIIKNAILTFESESIERNQTLVFKPLTTETLAIFGVSILVEQALNELVRNALIYSSDGSQTIIQLARQDNWGIIRVIDHGRGIPPEMVDQVWDILTQSQRYHYEQQGAGIGLSIVKLIVEAHGGNVRLESSLNQGTMVTISLPLYDADDPLIDKSNGSH